MYHEINIILKIPKHKKFQIIIIIIFLGKKEETITNASHTKK